MHINLGPDGGLSEILGATDVRGPGATEKGEAPCEQCEQKIFGVQKLTLENDWWLTL